METWFSHSFLYRLFPERCGVRLRWGGGLLRRSNWPLRKEWRSEEGRREHLRGQTAGRVGEGNIGEGPLGKVASEIKEGKSRGLDSVTDVGESA